MDELKATFEQQWAAVEASGDPAAAVRFVADTYPVLFTALEIVTEQRDIMQTAADAIAAQIDTKVWEWATMTAPEALPLMYRAKITPLLEDLHTLAADAAERVQEALEGETDGRSPT